MAHMTRTRTKQDTISIKSIAKPIIYVVLCTLFTATGQILWKLGAGNTSSIISIITNIPLLSGFVSYAIGAVLLILALKYADLSIVYPFIALSFIWVNIASIFIFKDQISVLNWLGILAIFVGVSMIGLGSRK